MHASRRQFWIVLVVSTLALTTGATFVLRHIAGPSDGARLPPGGNSLQADGVVISVLRAQPFGLQDGDLVTGVNGRSLESWAGTLLGAGPRAQWERGQELNYQVVREGQPLDVQVTLGAYPIGAILVRNWGLIAFGVFSLIVGGFVFLRRPNLPAAQILFLSVAGLAGSTAWSFGLTVQDFTDGVGFWLFKLATLLFYDFFWTAGFHFVLIFPKPFEVTRKRWFVPVLYGTPLLLTGVYLLAVRSAADGTLDWFRQWTPAEGLHAAVFLLGTIIGYALQFRRASRPARQQQIRWVTFAGILSGGAGLLLYILPPFLGLRPISVNIVGLVVLPYPIAIAIAILRHNLFDIDTLINRALVYGTLTAGTMAIYVLLVGFIGSLLGIRDQGLIAFLTTGLVAVLFQPLRDRLQGAVNRLMYGERDDPYTVLAGLGTRLEGTLAPAEVLPAIVETVAETLRLPYTALNLKNGEQVAYGVLPARVRSSAFPLVFQGEDFGQLEAAPRAADEPFTQRELELLQSLARQIEVAVHNVLLNQDLQRSRQQLVTAREEERRRIRRDLHDGLGTQLASQMLVLDAIDRLMDRDPEAARRLLHGMKDQSQQAVADIRRLIYGLRPPALDDLGLAEALKQEFTKFPAPPHVHVEIPERLPHLPAATELAAYRILQEAVNNVVKHSAAQTCKVKIVRAPDGLTLSVIDDGLGLPEDLRKGVGMHAMAERAEELGGQLSIMGSAPSGTQIRAWLPLNEE